MKGGGGGGGVNKYSVAEDKRRTFHETNQNLIWELCTLKVSRRKNKINVFAGCHVCCIVTGAFLPNLKYFFWGGAYFYIYLLK